MLLKIDSCVDVVVGAGVDDVNDAKTASIVDGLVAIFSDVEVVNNVVVVGNSVVVVDVVLEMNFFNLRIMVVVSKVLVDSVVLVDVVDGVDDVNALTISPALRTVESTMRESRLPGCCADCRFSRTFKLMGSQSASGPR